MSDFCCVTVAMHSTSKGPAMPDPTTVLYNMYCQWLWSYIIDVYHYSFISFYRKEGCLSSMISNFCILQADWKITVSFASFQTVCTSDWNSPVSINSIHQCMFYYLVCFYWKRIIIITLVNVIREIWNIFG